MQTENLIAASVFCSSHNIEYGFINSLRQYGLIEVTTAGEELFINSDDLNKLEQFTRFYYDMQINLEGIEVVDHLLQQLQNQQREIVALRNKLLAAHY
jgi:hypothetical protein